MIQLFCNVLKLFFSNYFKDQKAQGNIYKCADHEDCSHQYRVQGLKDSIKYVVQTCGKDHSLSSTIVSPPRGLHWSVSSKVDQLLQAGVSAGRILSQLKLDNQIASQYILFLQCTNSCIKKKNVELHNSMYHSFAYVIRYFIHISFHGHKLFNVFARFPTVFVDGVVNRSLRMKICLSVHGFVVSEKKQWWNTGSKLFAKLSLQKFKLRKPRKKFALQLNMKEMKTLRSRFQTPRYEHDTM